MKKTGIIILLSAIIMNGFCLKVSADSQAAEKQEKSDNKKESTKVTIGKDLISVEENDSALNLRAGNRGLSILESLEGHSSIL